MSLKSNRMITTAEEIYNKKQVDYVLSRLKEMPEEIIIPLPSEWAEKNRYLPRGVSDKYYGSLDWENTPHLKQPLDDCHPDAIYTHITNMKSVQSANTVTLAENLLGFVIRYMLGSVLFLTSTKTMSGIRGSANIDVMIDNSGLMQYLKPASNRTGKKTKDNTLYKEFMGNNKLLMTSYNSIADLKSNTFGFIIEDELDEAGKDLKDQGDVEGIIEGRTMGLDKYKILQISTSGRAETSRIYHNFLRGDQNEYFMPCPLCGEMQLPVLKRRGDNYGLTFTTEKSKSKGTKRLIPETVRYTCKYCGKDFYEHKKRWMLNHGTWIPQAEPEDRKRRSYHSPGLISPFLSWERICQQFIKSKFGDDLLIFKDFTINYLGNPWAAVKQTANWEMLKNRAEDYAMGIVPSGEKINISGLELYSGPLLLFGGVDVQGDRLELHVVGFGINSEKWSVDYQIFYGKTEDINDQCWISLHEFVYTHEYKILDRPAYIEICAIDSGYNPRKDAEKRNKDYAGKTHIVYEFVSIRTDKFIAVMGDPKDNAIGVLKESKITDVQTSLTKRYMVSVSLLKEMIMGVIENDSGYGAIHVPKYRIVEGMEKPQVNEWYQQFLSEQFQEDPKNLGKYCWCKVRNRNEVLDTFIYAIAAADYYTVNRWNNEQWNSYYLTIIS